MWNGPATLTTALAGVGLTWLVQSTVLLALGLLAGRLLKRVGAAVQSGVYRTTLAAVLVCPFASAILTAAGYDGLTFRLPTPTTDEAHGADLRATAPLSSDSRDGDERSGYPDREWWITRNRRRGWPMRREASRYCQARSTASQPAPNSLSASVSIPATIGLSVWLFGAAVMGARLVVGHRQDDPAAGDGGPGRAGCSRRSAATWRGRWVWARRPSCGARSCSAPVSTDCGGRRSCCRRTSVKTCARRSFMNSRTSPGATACGTS